jgi:predicted nuclease of predicted toxin-antitoxin system
VSLTFFLDEDISYRVAEGLRQRGIDTVSVHEVGRANQALTDEEQLRFAADQGRVLVTYNRADYQALDSQWRLTGQVHAGIVWCNERSIPRRAMGDLIRAIETLSEDHDGLENLCIALTRRAP